jgi:hypothetical protein
MPVNYRLTEVAIMFAGGAVHRTACWYVAMFLAVIFLVVWVLLGFV